MKIWGLSFPRPHRDAPPAADPTPPVPDMVGRVSFLPGPGVAFRCPQGRRSGPLAALGRGPAHCGANLPSMPPQRLRRARHDTADGPVQAMLMNAYIENMDGGEPE